MDGSNADVNSASTIGSNKWWLKHTTGSRLIDKLVLNLVKKSYLGLRVALRLVIGRRRRNELLMRKKLDFKGYLYHSLSLLGLENRILIEILVNDYGYKISCPINKEDLIVVTKHEAEIIDKYLRLQEGEIFVDVGAHLGRYTLIAANQLRNSAGRVVAIEAHPHNFSLLERNIALNRLTNVTALNCIAYSVKTRLKLYLPDEKAGYTMHHSVVSEYLSSKYQQARLDDHYLEIDADTIDNLLSSLGIAEVNWIKIDVEGAELEVLKGAERVISCSKGITLIIEIHGQRIYKQILDFISDKGFVVYFERTYENGEKHIIARKSAN